MRHKDAGLPQTEDESVTVLTPTLELAKWQESHSPTVTISVWLTERRQLVAVQYAEGLTEKIAEVNVETLTEMAEAAYVLHRTVDTMIEALRAVAQEREILGAMEGLRH